ncbi:MAG TPA: heavy metal sensor histidine kinase [Rubrivivax sp.]|nr:heavy metal sensor histidine kinase [Rubrivivax sp.]
MTPMAAAGAATRPVLQCPAAVCSHSIGRRLSRRLALFTMAVLTALFSFSWFGVGMLVQERNTHDLHRRCELLSEVLSLEARAGGEAAVLQRLKSDAPMRAQSQLKVWRADHSLLWADEAPQLAQSSHLRTDHFEIEAPGLPGGALQAAYTVDFSRDAAIGRRWGWLLVLATLAAGALVSVGARWHVQRQLMPLHDLAAQTRAMSAGRLHQRLKLADPAEELLPWIEQFNALMARLEQSYAQLEGFNADVAHELRTPLANLMGQTEVALSRERPAGELRDTLASNLEEMQRLSAMVNDMLFLSQADRGAVARRGQPVSLAALVHQVAEFHEGPLDDARLRLQVQGDATLAIDESLVKRALSNLLGNATRFAEPGSTVIVDIGPEGESAGVEWRVQVCNQGPAVDAEALPRLFDRFFRADESRCCSDTQHHGLGLAIVAAIARMHGGRTLAESAGGVTRIGFTLAPG